MNICMQIKCMHGGQIMNVFVTYVICRDAFHKGCEPCSTGTLLNIIKQNQKKSEFNSHCAAYVEKWSFTLNYWKLLMDIEISTVYIGHYLIGENILHDLLNFWKNVNDFVLLYNHLKLILKSNLIYFLNCLPLTLVSAKMNALQDTLKYNYGNLLW